MDELKLFSEKREYQGKEYIAYYVMLCGQKVDFRPKSYELFNALLEIAKGNALVNK